VSQYNPVAVSQRGVVCTAQAPLIVVPRLWNLMAFALLQFALVAILAALITHLSPPTERTGFHRRVEPAEKSVSAHASSGGHYRAKPIEVHEGLFRIALEAPDASCRKIADRFNRDHINQGWSVGKTYVAEFLREFKQWRAAPGRHTHSIDSACAVNRVWAIDLTEHRIEPHVPQPLPGILDHGGRRMLTLRALRDRSSIAILRLLLVAIEHYGRPKAIRTGNEAIFTSWVFAFALQWLDIRHQRTLPHCPWINGRIDRVWSTFKQVLRKCRIPDEVELQATLNMLRHVYYQRRPHQSLSGYTPDEAWRILIEKKRKSKPRDQTRRR
jgi:putative transposase